jgi:hypothetical protein
MQPSAADDEGHVEEPKTPHAQQAQGGADLVAPTMEQPGAVKLGIPAMEEPPATGPTSPGSGAHDEGDPSDEGLWSAMATSANPAKARAGATGDAPSNTTRDTPLVPEQTMAPTTSIVEVRLRWPIRAQ